MSTHTFPTSLSHCPVYYYSWLEVLENELVLLPLVLLLWAHFLLCSQGELANAQAEHVTAFCKPPRRSWCSEQEMKFGLFSAVKSSCIHWAMPTLQPLLLPRILLTPLHLSFLSNPALPTPGACTFLFVAYLPPSQAHLHLKFWTSLYTYLRYHIAQVVFPVPKVSSGSPVVFNTLVRLLPLCLLHCSWASQTASRCSVLQQTPRGCSGMF